MQSDSTHDTGTTPDTRSLTDRRSYFQKVAELERNDPHIRQLSDRLSRAIERGADSECQENIDFTAAVDARLGVPDHTWVTLPTAREPERRAR